MVVPAAVRMLGISRGLDLRDAGNDLAAPGEFAKADQKQREDGAEDDAQSRREQPGLDRIAHQENAAERERQTADPDHPLGPETAFEIAIIARW